MTGHFKTKDITSETVKTDLLIAKEIQIGSGQHKILIKDGGKGVVIWVNDGQRMSSLQAGFGVGGTGLILHSGKVGSYHDFCITAEPDGIWFQFGDHEGHPYRVTLTEMINLFDKLRVL